MPSPRVAALTKSDIIAAAKTFRWDRQMPRWSVIVEGRELPVRPLVLGAAGVPPNDPTNSHQAVAILQEKGFEVRYQGQATNGSGPAKAAIEEMEELIRSLRGRISPEDGAAMLAAREHDHRIEKDRWPR